MSWLAFFRNRKPEPQTAAAAKDRLQIILSHERISRNGEDFLPKLQQEIVELVARHVAINPEKVKVDLERGSDLSALAITVELPGPEAVAPKAAAKPSGDTGAKAVGKAEGEKGKPDREAEKTAAKMPEKAREKHVG
ncbi:cell division topological specificity factor MinE [Roseomonas gilardii]|uniref:cell division topological specificity factor MinE n=1 Tax=Roseomonas gilardii TaxID=257708 RepID=UPI0011A141DB|nr:cell division topological specificity factor MinE [Roseomonas gilardii]